MKERLEGTDIYQEFLHIMNEFGTSIADVSDLYKKVTAVLNQHPDLCEEFVAFLLPEQAMQCGKFMEYLMVTKMRDFFRKLEVCIVCHPNLFLTEIIFLLNLLMLQKEKGMWEEIEGEELQEDRLICTFL